MYDPARDSWKSGDDSEEPKPASETLEESNKPQEKDTNDTKHKTVEPEKSDNSEKAEDFSTDNSTKDSVSKPENDVKAQPINKIEMKQDKPTESTSPKESGEHDAETEPSKRKYEDPESSPHKASSDAATESKYESSSQGYIQHNSQSKPTESQKRYKRPRSRISQSERDETTRAIRERMERQEKNSKKIEEQQHDRFLVRNHYNQRPDQGHINRQQSPIIKLRSFNNWVKSMLIHQYARPGDIALDLGCGKGGDLLKWNRSKVAGFIGIDIAEVSIQQAMERSKSSRLGFWAKFIVGDPFEKPIEEVLQSEIFPVDVVSCQFCLHYSFESESRARMLLSNVSRILRVGCYFIGTIPNSEVIIKHIRRLEPNTKKWGNSIYSVEFERDPPRDGNFNPPFGHKYTFFLEDAVGNVPEYVVPFEAFRTLCEEYDLVLEYKKPFLKFFEEQQEDRFAMDQARRMKVLKANGQPGIEGDEREACGFYTVFAFKKVK